MYAIGYHDTEPNTGNQWQSMAINGMQSMAINGNQRHGTKHRQPNSSQSTAINGMQSACNYHAPKLSPIERGKGAFGALVIRAYKVEGGHL